MSNEMDNIGRVQMRLDKNWRFQLGEPPQANCTADQFPINLNDTQCFSLNLQAFAILLVKFANGALLVLLVLLRQHAGQECQEPECSKTFPDKSWRQLDIPHDFVEGVLTPLADGNHGDRISNLMEIMVISKN
eukprot:c10119_g1_i3.p1 GENE.c10119_g1_i3~~c10119_g1_i3.p1  ORF type:complete len:133 (+),score=27.23 c10119_g1_i3:273-671(+)